MTRWRLPLDSELKSSCLYLIHDRYCVLKLHPIEGFEKEENTRNTILNTQTAYSAQREHIVASRGITNMRRDFNRLFRNGSIALSAPPLGPPRPPIPEVTTTTFVTHDQFHHISMFPPYSLANKDLFLAWLRKGPRKEISEDDIPTFLHCWERGRRKDMIATAFTLTPFLPRAIIGSALEPTVMVPFSDAKGHPRFVLKRMSAVVNDCPRVVGLRLFADTVRCLIDRRMRVHSRALQDTIALVVNNCSGVGKTVASLAVCSRLNAYPNAEWFFSPLYIGFDSEFPLSAHEARLLESHPDNCEAVESIIARRLFLQLDALVRATGDGVTVEEATKDPSDSWCPKMPLPDFDDEFREYSTFPSGETTTLCVKKIENLSKRCGGNKLAILMIIDEGQLFDVKIKDGARIALRFARKLQAAVVGETHNAMLIPMMTGISSQTILSHSTDGRNLNVQCEILTRPEFAEMLQSGTQMAEKMLCRLTQKSRQTLTPLFCTPSHARHPLWLPTPQWSRV